MQDTRTSIYTVELNCLTYSEDKYFFDGLNYFMAAIGTDGNVYRLLQFSQPLWCDVPEDARFLGIDENVEIFIQNQRIRGNIIGADGNLIEVNRENRDQKQRSIEIDANAEIPNDSDFEYTGTNGLSVKEYLLSQPMLLEATEIAFPASYPSTIKVYIVSQGNVVTPAFDTYCKNVLTNEWTSYQKDTSTTKWYGMPDDAFDAGAIAVKQYGWWRILNPKYSGQGFDVKNTPGTDQKYVPGIDIASAAKNAYDRMDGMAIANSNGKMFLTQYRAGEYDNSGLYEGIMYQNGAAYLCVEKEFDTKPILNHYYGYCSALGGNGFVRYYYY